MKNLVSAPQIDLEELWARLERDGPLADSDLPLEIWDDDSFERLSSQQDRRRTFIAFYSWAVPNRESIAAISAFVGSRTLLEVCAGSGLWARLLSAAGVQVVATDGQPPRETDYLPLETLEAEQAVQIHSDCQALLVCWPPFRDACAFRALRAFAGDRVILVGDARFMGDQHLHDLLDQEWALRQRIRIPAWPGLDDCAYFYLRKWEVQPDFI